MMKKLLTLCLVIATADLAHAQNIGINANGVAPNASALLDIDAAALPAAQKRGLLIPRVALTAANAAAPVVGPATSLLVYNTATAGVAPNAVSPGFYYWNGAIWTRLFTTGDAWQTTGNTLTGTEIFGSVNSQAVKFYSNNIERMRINPTDGEVVVGATTSGLPGDMLCAVGNATLPWPVNGYTAQNGGGVYGSVTAGATSFSAVQGEFIGSGAGSGTYGVNFGTNASITSAGATGGYSGTLATGGAGVKGLNNSLAGSIRMGVYGSYAGTAFGLGVVGVAYGGAIPAGNNDIAVVGWRANNANYSGYFNGNHVVANGTKTASVGTSQGNQLLYVTETPEVWFEDIGRARLVNGEATVQLDPLFMETVFIDEAHPMHVFVQMEGESNDVYTVPGISSFQVKERDGGTSNAPFSYRIMAKRLNFQDHRFGCDPLWGPGDTRKYMEYAQPPKRDYDQQVAFQEHQKKNAKPALLPPGFTSYDQLQRELKGSSVRHVATGK